LYQKPGVTPPDIVDPEQATRHTAKAFGAIVAFQNGSDSETNFCGIRSTEYSRQKLRRHYFEVGLLGLRGASPASKVQMELHILKEKVLLKKNAPVMDPVWTKERWTNSKT